MSSATADKTTAAADKVAADKVVADKAVADKAASDKATADQAASDKAAADKIAADAAADKTAGKKPEGGEATKEGETADPGGAPQTYALTVPEGGAVEASDLVAIEKIARELGLPNAEAQATVDRLNVTLIEQSAALAAQLTADPVYGGANLPETQRLARSVIDRVRPEGHPRRASFLRKLDKGGAGNDIEFASFLADLGKMTSEDSPVSGAGAGGGDRDSLAKRMYPDQK